MSSLAHLQEINDRYGYLTREIVLDEATDPDHPLHDQFNWDDENAAHEHRLAQAGNLIRSFKIVYQEDENERKEVRAFLNTQDSKPPRYQPAAQVMADPVAKQLILQAAKREWLAFRRRYQHLEEFAEIIAMDVAVKKRAPRRKTG